MWQLMIEIDMNIKVLNGFDEDHKMLSSTRYYKQPDLITMN